MTKDQWAEMTEFMKEEPSVVTDYLETMYDELPESDIYGFYEAVFQDRPETAEKETVFEELLGALYDLTEERPKEFFSVMQRVKRAIVK